MAFSVLSMHCAILNRQFVRSSISSIRLIRNWRGNMVTSPRDQRGRRRLPDDEQPQLPRQGKRSHDVICRRTHEAQPRAQGDQGPIHPINAREVDPVPWRLGGWDSGVWDSLDLDRLTPRDGSSSLSFIDTHCTNNEDLPTLVQRSTYVRS